MKLLEGKRVLLGITGSISAYKTANLTSLLLKQGADVQAVLTDSAARFVSDLALESLAKRHCIVGKGAQALLAAEAAAAWADVVVVAPASADALAHIAAGLPDDAVCTAALSAACPVLVAPAMNVHMYCSAATQTDVATLASRGITVIPPASGALACGEEGEGKLAPEPLITEYIARAIAFEHDLAGKRILVTAGPTQEALDPVRFITNHSTGRMGYAIARIAMLRGAQVTLVSGPVSLEPPAFVEVVPVRSAQDMFEAVAARAEGVDAVIKAAAVADYRPANVASEKIKKSDTSSSLPLERTTDILAWLGAHRRAGVRLCGFAMETQNVLENSRAKLERKNVDMICANSLREEGAGFGGATNHLVLISRQREVDLPMLSKEQAAFHLLTELFALPERK